MPADIMYGPPPEPPKESYDDFVEGVRNRLTEAFEETRIALRRAAERNKRYYDVRVRPKRYQVGDWVYCFNPGKFARRQDKWERKYNGPFLVVGTPSAVNVQLQRRKTTRPFTVHIDKVKPYLGDTPKNWLTEGPKTEATESEGRTEEAEKLSDTETDTQDERAENADAEEITQDGHDFNEMAGPSSADYLVDDTENRDRPKREKRAPKYLGDFVRQLHFGKRSWSKEQ